MGWYWFLRSWTRNKETKSLENRCLESNDHPENPFTLWSISYDSCRMLFCLFWPRWMNTNESSLSCRCHPSDGFTWWSLSRKSSPNQKCWWPCIKQNPTKFCVKFPVFGWTFRETSQMSPSRLEIKGDELSIAFIKGQARWCDLTGRTPAYDILKSQVREDLIRSIPFQTMKQDVRLVETNCVVKIREILELFPPKRTQKRKCPGWR